MERRKRHIKISGPGRQATERSKSKQRRVWACIERAERRYTVVMYCVQHSTARYSVRSTAHADFTKMMAPRNTVTGTILRALRLSRRVSRRSEGSTLAAKRIIEQQVSAVATAVQSSMPKARGVVVLAGEGKEAREAVASAAQSYATRVRRARWLVSLRC